MRFFFPEDAHLGNAVRKTLNIMAIINWANLFLLNKTNTHSKKTLLALIKLDILI